jgi:uncharacterized protein (TIGR02996 family)
VALEADLLRAVLADPDSDAPRLACAAWCEEQPDPALAARGSFIRAQIALLGADETTEPDRHFALTCAVRDLEDAHRDAWIAPLALIARAPVFDRGFVELVTSGAQELLKHADQLFALAPIRHLTLTDLATGADALFASAHLDRIRSLRLDRVGLTDDDVERLAASPHLGELRWLWIGNNRVTRRGAEALAASRSLPHLGYVGFVNNPFDPSEHQGHDQGLIVDRWLPEEGRALEAQFGFLRWLHTDARTLMEVVPPRLQIPA